jgi:hypothetical protein
VLTNKTPQKKIVFKDHAINYYNQTLTNESGGSKYIRPGHPYEHNNTIQNHAYGSEQQNRTIDERQRNLQNFTEQPQFQTMDPLSHQLNDQEIRRTFSKS